MQPTESHKTRTLWLCGALHAFTHIYHVALMPLYLLIQQDFHLANVGQATLLVTVMGLSYFLPSYPLGWLADRVSRKKLLAAGLLINSLGFVGLSQAPNYPLALAMMVVAGFGGSFYHPAATALVARLFPTGTGRALGMMGIGAGVGFFIGPIYAGWRAVLSGWRAPVLELGLLGVAASVLFWWLADEEHGAAQRAGKKPAAEKMFATPALWFFFIATAFAFSLRDFGGSGMGSLSSLFLQKAHGYDPKHTGLTLSVIFLAGTISNPIFGHLSDRGRIRWTMSALLLAVGTVAIFPRVAAGWLVPVLAAYGFFFMASYPVVEAALMESVHDSVRGRVFGSFITVGGLIGNLSHWLVGNWVKNLGEKAFSPAGYFSLYGLLALLMLLSLAGLPCLHAIRRREHPDGSSVALHQPPAALRGP